MAPALELLPNGLWLEPEHGTNSHKGERPVLFLTQKPRFRLLGFSLHAAALSPKLTLETGQGIFEHGPQQRCHGTLGEEASLGVEKLFREYAGAGLQPRLPGIPVG